VAGRVDGDHLELPADTVELLRRPCAPTAAHAADHESHAYAHAGALGVMAVGIRIQTTSWLTAKLTANPHDNRGPWWTALDGYSPLELRRCGGRCPADQLTRAPLRPTKLPS
jgi:hypothetical protein